MSAAKGAASEILVGQFNKELSDRYLTYAMSTIMARALPDVRDGLKPVHRRVLYAMRMMKLDPEKGYKKSARVVGDVIGKYHPHGDQSVYDAMVRLSQDFALRYPLVDGQGNFGSIDGDSAAAMRYTEAKLTKVAAWIMKDLENGTVDFKDNYDESDSEPVVMPSCFPNLLANGGSGIAVGLSTSIPPHNVGELCGAMAALLKNRETRDATLLNHVKGPDFPLGGVLVESAESIADAYLTGKGGFKLRAKWEKEEFERGQYHIVVTEIPYQVQKSKLIEKLADLINLKKVPWLVDVRDESDENIRIVLEPKNRNVDADQLMEHLFKLTDLESRISLNMNVITSQGQPRCLSLKEALLEFLDHRRIVLLRKSEWRSEKIKARLHLLDAYRIVYLNIDEVIEIIKNNDHPAPIMMERFGIDDVQANAILDMRLRRLRKLEEMEIKREYDELTAELDGLTEILASEDKQTEVLLDEVKAIKKEFADPRRTQLGTAPTADIIPLEAMVEKEPMTVILSQKGWIRALKGHMADDQEVKYKEGDAEGFRVRCSSVDSLGVMSSSGKVFTLMVNKLPAGRGFGEPLQLMVDLPPEDKVTAVFDLAKKQYLVAGRGGYGFVTDSDNLRSQTKSGKQILNMVTADSADFCVPVEGNLVAAVSSAKKLSIFPLEEVSEMTRGKGVRLMKLRGETLESLIVFDNRAGLGFSGGAKDRVVEDIDKWYGHRGVVGKLPPHGFTKDIALFAPEVPESKLDEPQQLPGDNPSKSEMRSMADIDRLIKLATKPIPEDAEELDLFGNDDEDAD
ncbi:MAG: DNA topoisomerase IV subunit A [Magnetococcales bacterium]|nr:DNA topoisomerase IV subunit A [Magnetococcales bacterium]|tara:strand:- start:15365 stop:17752 length:2388 start_codon:yes stop_codon:yes gene_type:complete